MPVWGLAKSLGGSLSIMRMPKKQMWMTRLFNHFLCFFQCTALSHQQRQDGWPRLPNAQRLGHFQAIVDDIKVKARDLNEKTNNNNKSTPNV
jgi:hypothetical protein